VPPSFFFAARCAMRFRGDFRPGVSILKTGLSKPVRDLRQVPAGGKAHPDAFAEAAARLRAERLLGRPTLRRIASAMRGAEADRAEIDLQEYLSRHPDDAEAISLAAEYAVRHGRRNEAVSLLMRCLRLAPDFTPARYEHAKLLLGLHNYDAALAEVDRLLASDADNPLFLQLKAALLEAVGEEEQSLGIRQKLADENSGRVDCRIRLGDALRATGHRAKSIAAYRQAIACRPSCGRAWWSLANMKTLRFDDEDIPVMRELLDGGELDAEDRINLLFALGKAYEDAGEYAKSFEQYAKGNAARRNRLNYDWDDMARELATQKSLFMPGVFEERRDAGYTAPDPIFILGRPRAGSTLVEQILSSHSAIEGTAELPYVADSVWRLIEGECAVRGVDYPQILAELSPVTLRAMGEEYMERSRIHRKLGRPHFIDKAPANYHHVGLLLLILPNAKIIDARRDPAACCFSMFKHNYNDTNLRLSELGQVYRNYVELMAHFDRTMPGRIHRVIHEELVADPEAEIRRLFDYLELPFEETCLRHHETERTIRTPSSEQVRRPISGAALGHWRHFEPWLRPLLDGLGSVQAEYPRVPVELR
jgi:tetratricopeptide (TPR) repeat protein